MTISADKYQKLSGIDATYKDMMRFLSVRAKGNVVQVGMENGAATCSLLYGIETKGGHLWTINPQSADECQFAGHPQWTFVESDPQNIDYVRGAGVPEECDLLVIRPESLNIDAIMLLRMYGHTIKTRGLIIVMGVKQVHEINQACEDYAKSYGMEYHVRPGDSDLGVIFYPENMEVLKDE